jgi:hypothetical protein
LPCRADAHIDTRGPYAYAPSVDFFDGHLAEI